MHDWKTLSVAELERRYDQAVYASNAREINQWYTDESQRVHAQLASRRFQYGSGSSMYGYWFRSPEPGRPVVVFVHGGAWRQGHAEDYLFPAYWLTQTLNLNYVCLNFDNAPMVGGQIFPMLNQLIQAMSWVGQNAKANDALPEVHLVSHSSGSHLAACLAGLDWATLTPGTPGLLASVLLCSGIYDLEPVVHSKRREYLELSPVEVCLLSPVKHAMPHHLRIAVLRGENESPEFTRQHETYVAKLQRDGLAPQTSVCPQVNHFEVLQTFGQADGHMARCFQGLIRS